MLAINNEKCKNWGLAKCSSQKLKTQCETSF